MTGSHTHVHSATHTLRLLCCAVLCCMVLTRAGAAPPQLEHAASGVVSLVLRLKSSVLSHYIKHLNNAAARSQAAAASTAAVDGNAEDAADKHGAKATSAAKAPPAAGGGAGDAADQQLSTGEACLVQLQLYGGVGDALLQLLRSKLR